MRDQNDGYSHAQIVAAGIAHRGREYLISHVNGPRPIINGYRETTRRSLVNNKILQYWPPNTTRPKETRLTEFGRQIVCIVLGNYADALTEAKDFLEKLSAPPIIPDDREMVLAKLMAKRVF